VKCTCAVGAVLLAGIAPLCVVPVQPQGRVWGGLSARPAAINPGHGPTAPPLRSSPTGLLRTTRVPTSLARPVQQGPTVPSRPAGVAMRAANGRIRQAGSPLLRTVRINGAVAIATDDRTGQAFVSASLGSEGTVAMLDARTGLPARTTRIGSAPQRVVTDATGGRVFIASYDGIDVLDARTGAPLRTLRARGFMAVARRTDRVFVCSYFGLTRPSAVHVYDGRSLKGLRTVQVGPGAGSVAIAETAGRAFVPNSGTASVSVLDGRSGSVMRTVRLPDSPIVLAVDERAGHVFVASQSSVSMLDAWTGTVLHTTPINTQPAGIAIDTRTSRVFVTTQATVDVLSTRTGTLIRSTSTGVRTPPVSAPVVNPSTGHVVVLLQSPKDVESAQVAGPGTLLVIDGGTGASVRRVDTGPVLSFGETELIADSASTGRVFVLEGPGVGIYDARQL